MATISEALAIAVQHHQAGRLQAAEQIYRQILAVEPNRAHAWHLLGVVAHQVGRHGIAVEYIGRAIELNGTEADFHNNLGEVYRALRRIPEAAACCRRALELNPGLAGAHNNLGNAMKDQGNLDEAVACYRRALQLKPDFAEAHNNLGVAFRGQGKLDEAVACCRRALQLKPDYANAHNALGNALKDQGNLDEAVARYRRAVELKPDFAEAHNNLGIAFRNQGKLDEAVACYRRALELKPDYAEAHNNLGIALGDQGKRDEAITCYHRALELKPDYAEAHSNLGIALGDEGKRDEASVCYRRALELKPDYADAHWNQSFISLATGKFERGWAEYEWRWRTSHCQPRGFSQPFWDGLPLQGRVILLHAEQGLGDTIQFVRYVAPVKQRGGVVIVECPGPLLSLLTSHAGIDRLVRWGNELPAFDVQSPLLSLPGIFHTSLETIPAEVPYLFADPGLVGHWRQELARDAGFKIGIAWQGDPKHRNDHNRSIPLGRFEPLAHRPGVRLLSVQKGSGVEQLQHLAEQLPVTELGSRLDDFMDTAAVLVNLDLVITCDTSVAHLAGALGVPVWVAIPFVPDWRWLLDRSDSPWYPTMRLFRQDRRGDWQGVFRRVEVALGEQIAGRAVRPGEQS